MTRLARPPSVAACLILLALSFAAFGIPGARAQPPTLTILAPADGVVIGEGAPVIVSFLVTDFDLVQPGRVGQAVGPNEGHVAVFVDGQYARLLTRVEPIALSLDSGPHSIAMQLRGNDGAPLSPDVSASVTVTVTHGPAVGTPEIEILFPPYDLRTGHDVYVAVEISNFTVVEPRGRPNAPNEGHLQILVEGVPQAELSEYEPAFLVDLGDWYSTITVRLVNNDGTPLTPDVSASTRVYIKGPTQAYVDQALSATVVVLLAVTLAVLVRRRLRKPDESARRPETKT